MILSVFIDDLVQDCRISIASALVILPSCTKPSKYSYAKQHQDDICQQDVHVYTIVDNTNILHSIIDYEID